MQRDKVGWASALCCMLVACTLVKTKTKQKMVGVPCTPLHALLLVASETVLVANESIDDMYITAQVNDKYYVTLLYTVFISHGGGGSMDFAYKFLHTPCNY
jgi:uncharacterized membrane protein YczE